MHILKAFKTSKGIFWDMATAMKPENRAHEDPTWWLLPVDERKLEVPQEVCLLSAPVPGTASDGHRSTVWTTFELTLAVVK